MNIAVAVVRQHSQPVSLKSGNYVLTCNNMAWHGTYSIHVYVIVCTFSKPRQRQSQLLHSHCSRDGSTTASSMNSNSEVNSSPTTGSSLHSMPSTHLQAWGWPKGWTEYAVIANCHGVNVPLLHYNRYCSVFTLVALFTFSTNEIAYTNMCMD